MPLRRGKKRDVEPHDPPDVVVGGDDAALDAGLADADLDDDVADGLQVTETPAPRRPLDESEAGENDSGDAVPRLDLGSLRLPVFADLQLRVEMDAQQRPIAATLLHGASAVHLLAFAAPRGAGLWDDVRGELGESIVSGGGKVEEIDGVFGRELRARVQARSASGEVAEQTLRFAGFDGPRWFVRATFSGPAATDPKQASALEAVVTRVIVVRGDEPMAPRDALPLRLPTDVVAVPPPDAKPTIDPFTRGPEITEIQ